MKPHIEKMLRQAVELQKINKLDAAEALYEKIRREDPKNPDALHLLGVLHMTRGDLQKAQALIVKAIKIRSNDSAYYSNLGIVLKDQGNYSAAIDSLNKALSLDPNYPEALCNRGLVLDRQGKTDEAISDYDRALILRPNYAAAHSNRGVVLQKVGRHEEAIDSFKRAIAADPTFADGLNNFGAVLRRLRRYDESLKVYNGALKRDPNLVEAYQGRGELLSETGHIVEALADFDRALERRPGYPDALWAKGFTNLASGNFDIGWDYYEYRFDQSNKQCSVLSTPRPRWTGKISEKTLLVWSDQGVGDEIFFARWLTSLSHLATRFVVAVDARMLSTYRRSFRELTFVDKLAEINVHMHDQHLPMGSIPKSLKDLGLDWNLRKNTPYLIPDHRTVGALRESIGGGKKICGITWRSNRPELGADKTIPITDLLPVLSNPNFVYVNLQYGDTQEETELLRSRYGISVINVADIDNYSDLDNHAALLAACDELVLACNATAHIAGALGKRAFILAPRGKALIWYWHNNIGSSNIWYPTLELYFQDGNLSWRNAIMKIADKLDPMKTNRLD